MEEDTVAPIEHTMQPRASFGQMQKQLVKPVHRSLRLSEPSVDVDAKLQPMPELPEQEVLLDFAPRTSSGTSPSARPSRMSDSGIPRPRTSTSTETRIAQPRTATSSSSVTAIPRVSRPSASASQRPSGSASPRPSSTGSPRGSLSTPFRVVPRRSSPAPPEQMPASDTRPTGIPLPNFRPVASSRQDEAEEEEDDFFQGVAERLKELRETSSNSPSSPRASITKVRTMSVTSDTHMSIASGRFSSPLVEPVASGRYSIPLVDYEMLSAARLEEEIPERLRRSIRNRLQSTDDTPPPDCSAMEPPSMPVTHVRSMSVGETINEEDLPADNDGAFIDQLAELVNPPTAGSEASLLLPAPPAFAKAASDGAEHPDEEEAAAAVLATIPPPPAQITPKRSNGSLHSLLAIKQTDDRAPSPEAPVPELLPEPTRADETETASEDGSDAHTDDEDDDIAGDDQDATTVDEPAPPKPAKWARGQSDPLSDATAQPPVAPLAFARIRTDAGTGPSRNRPTSFNSNSRPVSFIQGERSQPTDFQVQRMQMDRLAVVGGFFFLLFFYFFRFFVPPHFLLVLLRLFLLLLLLFVLYSFGRDNFRLNIICMDRFPKYRSLEGLGAIVGV